MFRFPAKARGFYILELINTRTGAKSLTNSCCAGPFYLEVKRPERAAHLCFLLVPLLIMRVFVTKLSHRQYCMWINLTVPLMQQFIIFR